MIRDIFAVRETNFHFFGPPQTDFFGNAFYDPGGGNPGKSRFQKKCFLELFWNFGKKFRTFGPKFFGRFVKTSFCGSKGTVSCWVVLFLKNRFIFVSGFGTIKLQFFAGWLSSVVKFVFQGSGWLNNLSEKRCFSTEIIRIIYLFGLWTNTFWTIANESRIIFSRRPSTCPEETFQERLSLKQNCFNF